MLRLLVLFFLIISSVYADKKVEVFAANVDSSENIMEADGDVVVLYDGMYISSKSATYNRESGILELYGNVNALKGAEYYAMGDYMMLDTHSDIRQFRPFFFQEHKDELWISAQSAKSQKENYELHTGIVSSCNPQNPDWTIRFSSGYYDDEEQFMELYNARLYAGEVPVFYFPYFAYPTDTTRRTGLLRPTFGLSSDEGFMYQQPLFIAESPYWDLEIIPQLRTNRGEGLYTTLRFVDSKKSHGSLTVGGFKEKTSYQEDFQLRNQKHYGVEFDYEHRDFLQTWFDWNPQGSSGIFADITYLNDIEYSNLKATDSLDYVADSQVTSRVNGFLNQSENYYGVYGKYFIDLQKETNSDTIQSLPIIQYHRYLDSVLDNHLIYSFDYRGNNYYRETNKNAMQNEIKIPIGLQFPLLDEYITLSLSENIYGSHIGFYGSDNPDDPNNPGNPNIQAPTEGYSPGFYARDFQTIELNTNLVKAFDDFSHSMALNVAYLLPGQEKTSGFYDDYDETFNNNREKATICDGGPCEYDNIPGVIEQASVEFTQFVFLADGKEKLYHRLTQPLIYESGYDKYGDLENELRYFFTNELNFYNNTFYNYDRNTLSKLQNTLAYKGEVFNLNLSHLYTDKLTEDSSGIETRTKTSYLTTDARYNYSQKWQYFAGYAYDIELSETKNRHIGFLYTKRCWSVELKYIENTRPTQIYSAGGGSRPSSIQDKILYLTLNLRPIGGAEVNYKKSE